MEKNLFENLFGEFVDNTHNEEEDEVISISDVYNKYYEISKDNLQESDFWTNEFFKSAYNIITSRPNYKLAPIVIPSYNRPDNKFMTYAKENTIPGREYPVYFVVRESQKESYKKAIAETKTNFMHVVAFEDSLIDDIGKVREQIVKYFHNLYYKYIFMFDDDITKFSYSVPLKRETGTKISYSYDPKDLGSVMAMWQIAMECAVVQHPNLILSTGMVQGFSWVEDACYESHSAAFMRGLPTLAVCLNLESFYKNNINYRTIKNHGHDDIDLLIRALLNGCPVVEFRWITYNNPGIGTSLLGFNTVAERFERQYNEMRNDFSQVPFVKWRNRKGIKNVGINWNKCIEYFKLNGFENFSSNRFFDIWGNGRLLDDAKYF